MASWRLYTSSVCSGVGFNSICVKLHPSRPRFEGFLGFPASPQTKQNKKEERREGRKEEKKKKQTQYIANYENNV
jgi:hypothetical protein